MADGLFYTDLREPAFSSDLSAVTLSTTAKALYPLAAFPPLGANYFSRPGKKIRIRLFGKITTAATPGNLSFDVYWGTGADANGTIIVSSAAVALIASQTNLSWELAVSIRCVTPGSTGTLYGTGKAHLNVSVMASTNQPMMIPASAAAVSGSLDLTAAN